MSILRKLIGLTAALLLLTAIMMLAFYLARASPSFNPGWFYGVGICLYTMAVLSYMHLDPLGPKRQRRE